MENINSDRAMNLNSGKLICDENVSYHVRENFRIKIKNEIAPHASKNRGKRMINSLFS